MSLADYLHADDVERAAREANAWIKSLRNARVDDLRFRERFTYHGESLWWFAELYLHKEQAVLSLFRTIYAVRALLDRETPSAIRVERAGDVARMVLPQVARGRGIAYDGPALPQLSRLGLGAMDARSTALMLGALASPSRSSRVRAEKGAAVAAFVHRAFWRGDEDTGGAEAYIGPVLHALERRLPPGSVHYIAVGPAKNFRARRWWRREAAPRAAQPIETLAPRAALAGSTGLWTARHAMRRALLSSADLRRAAHILDVDCWPVIANALAGIALLQFPWSARAMDEAGAALDALQPAVALTYAEAGGWGRALALEARRRGIPLAGLQHGFIYRHWLNYLHEPDEMRPPSPGSSDGGFPLPARTLVFDEYAAAHLRSAGQFPPDTLAVTGSPRLDELAARVRQLTDADIARAREHAGAAPGSALVLLVTKYSEARRALPALFEAVQAMPAVHLAVKTHPAETPEAYERAAAGVENVRVLPATAPLAPLIRASQAIVTVNSTVALDALALGVPALSIGQPNNLTPFVDAGALAGAATAEELPAVLQRLLYDQEFRQRLSATGAAVVEQYRMAPDGSAAEQSASAVLDLLPRPRHQE